MTTPSKTTGVTLIIKCTNMYLHGPQLCLPPSAKPRALFLRSSGPLNNLLLKQNGRKHNRLLKPGCCSEYV